MNQWKSSQTNEYTGNLLVLFAEGGVQDGMGTLAQMAGLRGSFSGGESPDQVDAAVDSEGGVVFEDLGVAVVKADPEQVARVASITAEGRRAVLASEPERMNYTLGEVALLRPTEGGFDSPIPIGGGEQSTAQLSTPYLRGYRDAVAALYEAAAGTSPGVETKDAAASADTWDATWGLQQTGVLRSQQTGRGMRVAVLDTGLDLRHPDFQGRVLHTESFISGETAQDGHGHGTHCVGTALGPLRPTSGPRYGVAFGAEICAGKVLSNAGSGPDRAILAGIQWATRLGCQVISMSLGSPVRPGESYSQVYQNVAVRALQLGALIIVAAGNESQRPGIVAPVSRPANCPSILAVAATDSQLKVASFSCGGLNPSGGEVNVAGPGVAIHSSWVLPGQYRTIQGTSMAAPHVSGIAALWAEATGLRGMALANRMLRASRPLGASAQDVGWGLVQAP